MRLGSPGICSMRSTAFLAPILVIAGACTAVQEPAPLDPAVRAKLSEWLDDHARAPVDYVVGLFEERDVVFLGEYHRILHDVLLVQSLLDPLYRAGVHVLVTEFGDHRDQALIDSLVDASEWDEALARRIVFRQYPWWGYQEYVDVYRAAWELNASRPTGAPPFRVLGMNNQDVMSSESTWAEVILAEVEKGEKVLVHCGIHHAFTRYRQPIVTDGEFRGLGGGRAGNFVYESIGGRAATVFLHAPWPGPAGYDGEGTHPADGIIDALTLEREGGPRPVGFDVADTPFGILRIENTVYHHGYPEFVLEDFCDGWIYTKPISEYEGVTPIDGWIDEDNLEEVRRSSEIHRKISVGGAMRIIANSANIPRRFRHLR